MALILPNTIANETAADGDKLQQNFAAIRDWANQEAITSDGSTALNAPLLLPGPPTQPNQAATKAYVDGSVPIGSMYMYAGDTAPEMWQFCRGQPISRATYAVLFSVIGTRFGAGDTTTTFNLPDLRGRFPIGHNEGGNYFNLSVGQTGGTKDLQVPFHGHNVTDHNHNVGGLNVGDDTPDHGHVGEPASAGVVHAYSTPHIVVGNGGAVTLYLSYSATGGATTRHRHPIGGLTGNADRPLGAVAQGVDGTNQNLPPAVSFNYIMKVL